MEWFEHKSTMAKILVVYVFWPPKNDTDLIFKSKTRARRYAPFRIKIPNLNLTIRLNYRLNK